MIPYTQPRPAPDTLYDYTEEPWKEEAACRDAEDPDIFFPDSDDPDKQEKIAAAKKICGGCAVRLECYKSVMKIATTNSADAGGIYGGTTKIDRNRFRKRRQQRSEQAAQRAAEREAAIDETEPSAA